MLVPMQCEKWINNVNSSNVSCPNCEKCQIQQFGTNLTNITNFMNENLQDRGIAFISTSFVNLIKQ
jgi:hypothetical protein